MEASALHTLSKSRISGSMTTSTRETLLVAEDDESLRQLVRRILLREGYTVLDADSADDALTVSAQHEGEIALLLSDVVMPSTNGRSLAEQICATRPAIRVLFMSGYSNDDVLEFGVVAGKANFLPKPFSPGQLVARVREVLER